MAKPKHQLIMSLDEKKRTAIAELFRRGESAVYIADYIQRRWGLLTGEDPENLRKRLLDYKKDVVRRQVLDAMIDSDTIDAVSRLAKNVDVCNEMSTLFYIQKARVEKLLDAEMQMESLVNPNVTREIGVLKDIVREIKQLQLETGALKRAPVEGAFTPNDRGGFDFRFQAAAPVLEAFLSDAESYVVAE